MDTHLRRVRENVQRASEDADGETRENLLSIDEALVALTEQTEGSADPDDEADRFEEVEEKLQGLIGETDDETEARLREARDELDAYRQRRDLS